jgi:Tfp pilus assembly protein PilN
MKAVNLLPSDLRGAAPASAAVASGDQAAGRLGAFAVLGVLGFCVVALAAYVLTSNTVKDRQAKLAQVTAQTAVASAQAAKLKPYADFEAAAQTRVQTVADLAAARFDWANALRDIARAVPAQVTLTSLSASLSGSSGATGSDPLRASISSPAVTMQGCTTGQRAVASLLSRLHDVRGVTRVALSKSERPAAGATQQSPSATGVKACSGNRPPTFSVVAFFERSHVPATVADVTVGSTATSTTSATGATATSTPAPAGTASSSTTTPAAATPTPAPAPTTTTTSAPASTTP